MKRFFLFLFFSCFVIFVFAKDFTISNTFGGDEDLIGASDFMSFSKKSDGGFTNSSDTLVSDRIQFDADGKILEGRIRLDFAATSKNGMGVDTRVRGFVKFTPPIPVLEHFSFVAGNSCFSKFGINAAELLASDDYSSSGKLIKNGIGLLGDFDFGEEDFVNLKISASIDSASLEKGDESGIIDDADNLNLNFGFDCDFKKMVSLGGVIQNVTSGNRRFGIFAGTDLFGSLVFNTGFLFNFSDDDFLPLYEDKKQIKVYKTKYALQFSTSYSFDSALQIPLSLSADFISGLNEEYIHYADKREVYETVSRKNGGIPYYACFRISYDFTKNFEAELSGKIIGLFKVSGATKVVVYPNVSYDISKGFGTVHGGVRLVFDEASGNGLTDFSIPLSWKIKFSPAKK